MLIFAPFLGPCFPSGLSALRTLGSDGGLSSVFLSIHALPCNKHHPPAPFSLFGTFWPVLAGPSCSMWGDCLVFCMLLLKLPHLKKLVYCILFSGYKHKMLIKVQTMQTLSIKTAKIPSATHSLFAVYSFYYVHGYKHTFPPSMISLYILHVLFFFFF